MNKTTLGYHMMLILSVIDGSFKKSEGYVISEYLSNQKEEMDIANENKVLVSIPKEALKRHFSDCARMYANLSTSSDRLDFLTYAYKLAMINGLHAEEIRAIENLGEIWQIDTGYLFSNIDLPKGITIQ